MLTAAVKSRNRLCKVDMTTCTVDVFTEVCSVKIKKRDRAIKVTTAIQEQSINSNILLRGKISFHVRGFVMTIDLSMVMRSTAARQ